jgi:hypothetical protein
MDVYANFKRHDIDLKVTYAVGKVTAVWDTFLTKTGPTLEFFLSTDTTSFNGLFIGRKNEKDATFNYQLTDTLKECLYYLYTIRYDGDIVDKYYSTVPLYNNKGNLQQATNVTSQYFNSTKKLTVKWDDPNTNKDIIGYLVRLIQNGNDTIVARPYVHEKEIELDYNLDITKPVKVQVAVYTHQGYQSCWSAERDVILDVEDYPLAGYKNENDRLSIFPNPATMNTSLDFRISDLSQVKMTLHNLLGSEIATLADGYYQNGIHRVKLDTELLPSGTYFIHLMINGESRSKMLVISK